MTTERPAFYSKHAVVYCDATYLEPGEPDMVCVAITPELAAIIVEALLIRDSTMQHGG